MSSREQRLEAALKRQTAAAAALHTALMDAYKVDPRQPLDDALAAVYAERMENLHARAQSDAVLGEQEATPPKPCAKCGYAGGCMEPWAAVSLDDPGDMVLIPCGTCPACRKSAPQEEATPPEPECDHEMCLIGKCLVAAAAPQGEGEPTQEELLMDDLLRCMEVRNLALEEAALYVQPGPDGQDYLDRRQLIHMWVAAAHERHDDGERAASAHIDGGPPPSLAQWAALQGEGNTDE